MERRYARNEGTIGHTGQEKLSNAAVAVVGAGGLGGLVIELLARIGIGNLLIIDGDGFEEHNLNRQLLATEKNLGENKAMAAAKRIAKVNASVRVEAVPTMLTEENARELLRGMTAVVDCLDNFDMRRIISRVARELSIPLVHAAIAGFTGQVTTIMPGTDGMERLYRESDGGNQGIELLLGNPATTPAFAASLQAQEVVKLVTGVGDVLDGKLLYFDLEHNIFEIYALTGGKK